MIDWQVHSDESAREASAHLLANCLAEVHASQRILLEAESKLKRQRAPKNIAAISALVQKLQADFLHSQETYQSNLREVCSTHLEFNIDDIVEVCSNQGTIRQPIIVSHIEFCHKSTGQLYLRVQGIPLAESLDGRPQLKQGFDVFENDASRWLVRLN